MRLSDLLERIRPVGAPGAASEGEQQRQREDRERELAELIRALHSTEVEAAQQVACAERDTAATQAATAHAVAKLRAGLPDLLAVQRTETFSDQGVTIEREGIRVIELARNEADRVTAQAAAGMPELVAAALQSIWSTVLTQPNDSTAP